MRQTFAQQGKSAGLVDVELLDGHPPVGVVGEIVQRRSGGGVANGADDSPAPVEELRRHRVAQAARGADDESFR